MSDNIKVVVKIRPLISREIEEKLSYQWRVKNNSLYQLDQNGKELGQSFTFDKVYDKDTRTSDVYNDIAKPIVEAATAGFNGTIFAYGQTSSGKTYTMTGTDNSPGIIPLAILNLFEIIKNAPDRDFLVRVSYLEIYNETVKDLLNPEKENIKIHESLQGIKVDVMEKVTSTPEEVLEAMKEGEVNRQKGATNMNEQSSRSHSIFQITIESREHIEGSEEGGCVIVSQLNLVDLAGSERAGQTGATGLRFKEGTHINKSLSSLALVIKQLSEDPKKFANYRDSKLTRILQNSLGGNAKTSIICAVTPAAVEETISTLQFANRAKAIKNKPEVNEVATDATMIQSLTKQMSKLQAQLESKKNIEHDNQKLQKQIASLQKLIINGFAQRRSLDIIGGSRRKLQQPRRITISAFHTTERDDEPVAPVPKFCTPTLKYNPNVISKPVEFAPIQNANKLASVPEEPASRLVTPPPSDRRVNFNDEVIEIDSDDDSTQGDGEGPCSPYHTCQDASKTPPCVLRKTAKLAEKQMKDILELTERERIYKPNVVELMEKIEHNTTVISKLEDEVHMFRKYGQEKDYEVEQLKNKIKKTEEEIKSVAATNADLQTKCGNYETKLTDWEVSFDTLKRKAKLREQELLSLLDELRVKKAESIGKQLSHTIDKEIPFMDMSKDISLINSDNDTSIINAEPSEHMCDLVTDTQTQSSLKNQTIIELEANVFSHKQKIASLENLSQDLQDTINGFEEKLANMENENSVLKSTIDNLKSTINGQKATLESAHNDIESYNSVIQELQIKLTQKDDVPNININDSVLESMIANEEKFLANNENMKNIIQSLRNVLDNRNKEINQLKSTLQSNKKTNDNGTLSEDLETKSKQIDTLNLEVDILRKQVNENIAMINKLMHEKNGLKVLEQELTIKMADIQENNYKLEQNNKEYAISVQHLIQENEQLTRSLANYNEKELEFSNTNRDLKKQVNDLSTKIIDLEKDVNAKDDVISCISQEDKQCKENIQIAKTAICKIQAILSLLTGEIQEVPELIDNFVNIFSVFSDNLNTLEAIAAGIVQQKEQAIENSTSLKNTLQKLLETHKSEISELQNQIDELNKTKSNYGSENEMFSQLIHQLKEDLERSNHELQTKLSENVTLKTDLNETIRRTEKLHGELMSIKDTKLVLNAKEEELKAALEFQQSYANDELRNKDDVITTLSLRLKELESTLGGKSYELEVLDIKLHDVQKEKDELLANILKKASYITDNCNIENRLSCDFEENNVNIHERILRTLDKIANHITFIGMKNVDCEQEDITKIISEAKEEIKHLTERNLTLTSDLFNLGDKNSELSFELEKIQSSNKNLNEHLVTSQEILQSVKKELKMKANELLTMEEKVKEWRDQFLTLDILMKQQMHELHLENEYLKSQCSRSDLTKHSDHSIVNSTDSKILGDNSHEVKNKKQLSDFNKSVEIISPPSLLTICCNKIVDSIHPNSDCKTPYSSDTLIEVQNDDTRKSCRCIQLSEELKNARDEYAKIKEALEESEILNQQLIKEQEDARCEIQLLLELEQELLKKLVNHRTNLSILTATTYAENKSLKSQVKVLQHHHSRFHIVCQRDIPDFKKHLRELMSLLNGETSNTDTQNTNFKRYSLPDVLDSSAPVPNFRNESTLDGDLLMLDTNITLTTAADNTLLGPDQTCFDITQTFFNEACRQTDDTIQVLDQNIHSQMDILSHDNQALCEKLQLMRDENLKLRELVDKYSEMKDAMIDAQSSPMKIPNIITNSSNNDNIKTIYKCSECMYSKDTESLEDVKNDLKSLSQELLNVKSQKSELELKYKNLVLETPSTDALVRKLNNLEKDHTNKVLEIAKLNKTLDSKNREIKRLEDENDSLSTQVMENITEADDLNKELDTLKLQNSELTDKCNRLEQSAKEIDGNDKSVNIICTECLSKDKLIQSMRLKITKSKLNRSLSDSDTSSRYNKICTLQSELHAGREDCKELTEDVVTIKNHLDRSNLSMDLDESMGDSSVFAFAEDFAPASPQSKKCNMPDIPEERHLDMYLMDKIDCYSYYSEKTGIETENFNRDLKIIQVMKMLYENLTLKHGSEVGHLTNKLREYNDEKKQLQKQIDNVTQEYSKFTKEIQEKEKDYSSLASVLSQIKMNINTLNQDIINASETDKDSKLFKMYKENILKILDEELGLSSVSIFEHIVNKHQADLAEIMEQYTKLQNHMQRVTTDLNSVNDNLSQMKCQLSNKENEYNLLKAQKERIHEISNAVTLDIVKREKELNDTMTKGYQRLLELNILTPSNVNLTLPLNMNINLLFEHLITQNEHVGANIVKEKEYLEKEFSKLKSNLEDKEKELAIIKTRNDKLQEINNSVTLDLIEKANQMQLIKNMHEELNQVYESKVDENQSNIDLIEKMTEEVYMLKATITDKEKAIETLEDELNALKQNKGRVDTIIEIVETIKDENANLKAVNEIVIKEKESYALELQKSGETIRQNNIELAKMTADILVLRESVKDNISVIENLKAEAKTLVKENLELKEQFEEKCRECSRLETNIKTHEKTAEIQTRIITRLEKQKSEDDKAVIDKNKQLEEFAQKYDALQTSIKNYRDDNESLRKTKESLEAHISDLETALDKNKSRPSMEAIADSSRRRRQSMHDSKRLFAEDKRDGEDHAHMEVVFGSRSKPNEFFMDVDDDFSDRSTPISFSKGHESLSASRTDQSDKDEEPVSRASSVLATRRRRQSSHDLHRAVPRHTPEPHDLHSSVLMEELTNLKATQTSATNDSELSEMKRRLASCQQELEDLKEKYRELDDECETCAEYLRERDEQCGRLKKEKTALEVMVTELKEKLQSCDPNVSQKVGAKRSVADAAVNTDEDWANLHSVVVDRMSYDAEVEKNKKLTKTIEELRFKKQDLKNTLSKMQKALEKNSGNRELAATKQELEGCKEELQELRERYKELDEECETCAQYLREKEEQCRKLKEAKMALEAKLQEFQDDVSTITHTARKKRQTAHDQNRAAQLDVMDAATETTDFLSYQVERDDSVRALDDKQAKETKRLKTVVEKLSQQKAMLEQQLVSSKQPPHTPMYVATGSAIVQNQQITDVMKENQRLKKINAKLVNICKKRGKDSNQENVDPGKQG